MKKNWLSMSSDCPAMSDLLMAEWEYLDVWNFLVTLPEFEHNVAATDETVDHSFIELGKLEYFFSLKLIRIC
jgi:hypothetical protein